LSRGAVPEIKKLLDDEDEKVRKAAATALMSINPDESKTAAMKSEE
jgi:HEAT repeat protein